MDRVDGSEPSVMDGLPEEILEKIFHFLCPYREFDVAALVCKKWHRIIRGVEKNLNSVLEKRLKSGEIELYTVDENTTYNPKHRSDHSVCYNDYTRSLFVFGGSGANNTFFNDLFQLDMNTLVWARPVCQGKIPPPKASCCFCSYKQYLLLFGGRNPPRPSLIGNTGLDYFSNALHVYDTIQSKWSVKPFIPDSSPPPMASSKCCVFVDDFDPELVILGGSLESNVIGTTISNNSIWCLSLTTWTWQKQSQWFLHGGVVDGTVVKAEPITSSLSPCTIFVVVWKHSVPCPFFLYKSGFCEWSWRGLSINFSDYGIKTQHPWMLSVGNSLVFLETGEKSTASEHLRNINPSAKQKQSSTGVKNRHEIGGLFINQALIDFKTLESCLLPLSEHYVLPEANLESKLSFTIPSWSQVMLGRGEIIISALPRNKMCKDGIPIYLIRAKP
ncbi:F-box only protein 42-like [Ciona intestinalis]